MDTPEEREYGEEAHYYHTLQYFNELVRKFGAKRVVEDLKILDLTVYEDVVQSIAKEEKKRPLAAIFRDVSKN